MRLLGRRGGGAEPGGAPEPDAPIYAVGDVHGQAGLLRQLLRKLDAHWHDSGEPDGASLVMLGNYVDRGPSSAHVLQELRRIAAAAPGRAVCLMGSHERMLLDFLDDPARRGPRWLRNGGRSTLRSYGVHDPLSEDSAPEQLEEAAKHLREGLGDLEVWLRDLPLAWNSGNVVATHAGADPDQPIDKQSERALIWGHPEFEKRARADGLWVVRGHIPVSRPKLARGRISIDTGAGYGGPLTAVALRKGAPIAFIEAAPRKPAPRPS